MKHRRVFILILATSAILVAPGCYSRVTKAKGIGADYQHPDRYESSEPRIDKWIDSKTGKN
jgi:hypothetical protein